MSSGIRIKICFVGRVSRELNSAIFINMMAYPAITYQQFVSLIFGFEGCVKIIVLTFQLVVLVPGKRNLVC